MGVKYGFYSKENWALFRSSKLPNSILINNLLNTVVADTRPEFVLKRIRVALKQLQIHENSFKI